MHHNVDAVPERLLMQRRGIAVVDTGADAARLSDARNLRNILHHEHAAGWAFQIDERGLRADGALNFAHVAAGHQRIGHVEALAQIVAHEVHRRSVGRADHHDVAARAHKVHNGAADGAHAGREAQRTVRALQRSDLSLGNIQRRIFHARVDIAAGGHAVDVRGLHKQRILVNRRHNRAAESGVLIAHMGADILRGGIRSVQLSQKSHGVSSSCCGVPLPPTFCLHCTPSQCNCK